VFELPPESENQDSEAVSQSQVTALELGTELAELAKKGGFAAQITTTKLNLYLELGRVRVRERLSCTL
jgi:hypothetical protein